MPNHEIERSAYLTAISDVCKYLKNRYKIAKLLNHLCDSRDLTPNEYEALWEEFIPGD